jgi:hypothetical protein
MEDRGYNVRLRVCPRGTTRTAHSREATLRRPGKHRRAIDQDPVEPFEPQRHLGKCVGFQKRRGSSIPLPAESNHNGIPTGRRS